MIGHRLILVLLAGCATSAVATAALADPPQRVGRVSFLQGDVSFTPPGETEWTPALRNFPVATGEAFWTGDAGRAELQVGAVELRLDSETELDVADLDYGQMRLGLPQGSMDLRLWRAPRGGVVVATPAGDVRIDQPGAYRIDVAAQGDDGSYPPVQVTTLEGAALAPGAEALATVEAGQAALLYAGYDPQFDDAQDAAIDDWARQREARERWAARAANDDDDAITGYDELASQGDFFDDATYGQVWFPRNVPADWAPYRDGHWAFVQPWGWTWIDDQPWGFAPFHYGRWAQIDGRWAWVRGRPTREPVYAPALVAFVGGGGWNFGVSIGGSGRAVGWVPLAPDEVYRPSYRVSETYVRQVNVTNVRQTTITNITINSSLPTGQYRNLGAATVVRSEAFTHGAPVRASVVAAPREALAAAPPVPAMIALRPDRAALTGGAKPPLGAPVRPGEASTFGPRPGPAPPPRLAAVRAALDASRADPSRPPVIAGAHQAPPRPRTPDSGPPAPVAPSQIHNPSPQFPRAVGAAHGPPAAPGVAPTPQNAYNRDRPPGLSPSGQGFGAAPAPDYRAPRPHPPVTRPPAGPAVAASPNGAPDAQAGAREAAARARQAQQDAAMARARAAQAAQAAAEAHRRAHLAQPPPPQRPAEAVAAPPRPAPPPAAVDAAVRQKQADAIARHRAEDEAKREKDAQDKGNKPPN